jgi:hypothetical protein
MPTASLNASNATDLVIVPNVHKPRFFCVSNNVLLIPVGTTGAHKTIAGDNEAPERLGTTAPADSNLIPNRHLISLASIHHIADSNIINKSLPILDEIVDFMSVGLRSNHLHPYQRFSGPLFFSPIDQPVNIFDKVLIITAASYVLISLFGKTVNRKNDSVYVVFST